jgi:DNA mismatch repair protein MutL
MTVPTMAKILRLDESLVTLIAAGEVVERPASVVKELVDNALDAGATRIAVEVEESGKRRIEVGDDGEGMSAEDARLALERHATSKIREPADLARVVTLGFRGEALPSIAAVSRFELVTAAAGAEAVRVRVEGGEVPRVEPAVRARGTTVTVRDLFFATPGRRKFLKSDATELRRLLDAVVEAALARPDVSFSLRSGTRDLLRLPAAGGLVDRIAALYGPEYAASLVPFAVEVDGRGLRGLLQRPDATGRGSRRQLLFVNGRPVQDRALTQAAFRGYASTLPQGAWPHVFLLLSVPPDQVDVNVHPAKREVRFREPDALFGFVQSAVRRGLGGLSSAAGLERSRRLVRLPAGDAAERNGLPLEAAGGAHLAREARDRYALPTRDQLGLFLQARPRAEPEDAAAAGPAGPRLWQLHDTYILVQTGTGLAVIDQHSAHERVLYESLIGAFDQERPASQELVFPRTYQLGPAEWHAWQEHGGLLERLGFRIEPFGERTVALRAVPVVGWGFQPEEGFLELLGDLAEARAETPSRHEVLARALACRGAIKAGRRLSSEEMRRLFDDLFATSLPTADVHGRPAVIQIRLDDLARRFERA